MVSRRMAGMESNSMCTTTAFCTGIRMVKRLLVSIGRRKLTDISLHLLDHTSIILAIIDEISTLSERPPLQ